MSACNCLAYHGLGRSNPHEPWCQTLGGWECPHCDEPRFPDEAACPECRLPRAAVDAYAREVDGWFRCKGCSMLHPSVRPGLSCKCDACADRICNASGYELHYAERGKLLAKILAEHAA